MTFETLNTILKAKTYPAFSKDAPVGTTVTGTIVSAREVQKTEFGSKEPEYWPNGEPKMQAVINIQTDVRQEPDDTGERSIFIPLWGIRADRLAHAIREAGYSSGAQALAEGNIFTARYDGVDSTQKGFPTKVYTYSISPAPTQSTQAPEAPAGTDGQPLFGENPIEQYKFLRAKGLSQQAAAEAASLSPEAATAMENSGG